ncbi:MAG: sugar phosphate isomerase/epimerase, partial [Actinobacteria bacterium]|nr:sugar phosphate isomerase/epimerase [Actinomycetota bacterium]
MVKILLDPSMYHPHLSVAQECQKAADLGYSYLELSPRWDFHEWHHYPKVDRSEIAKVNSAMAETGVKIWTFNPVFNWASPDEQERAAQVRNFRRLLQIAHELEVPLIATELSGDPTEPLKSEHQFFRSIEDLAPDFEKYGIECTIEAHYAGDRLRHVHIADVYNHLANVGNRYIVNPPGVDARIHQHNEIGNGEVPWDEVFGYLRETKYDGPVSVCVFGWEERADDIHVAMRERIA